MVSRWEPEAWTTCHLDPVAEPGQNKHSPTHDTLIGIFARSAEQYAPTASYSWTERGRPRRRGPSHAGNRATLRVPQIMQSRYIR
jgi:hypothetical protein